MMGISLFIVVISSFNYNSVDLLRFYDRIDQQSITRLKHKTIAERIENPYCYEN